MFTIKVQEEDFDIKSEHGAISTLGPHVGAIVSFVGQVRDEPLELEHYPGMAEKQMESILQTARERWPLIGACVIHRHGSLSVGDQIVLVITASEHRVAAFEAASFLMDWLKTSAPFWKRTQTGWVEARDSDDRAAERWNSDL